MANKRRRKTGIGFVTGFVVAILSVTAVSLGGAAIWQNAEDSRLSESSRGSSQDNSQGQSSETKDNSNTVDIENPAESEKTPDGYVNNVLSPQESSAANASESQAEQSQSSSQEVAQKYIVREEFYYALPQTAQKTDKSYYDDALFFGDSISVGIPGYHVMENAAVVAFQGINTININTKEVIDVNGDGNRVTMLQAAKTQYPDKSKIYIMLGSNGLGYDKQPFIQGYADFIDAVKAAYPGAKIYIESMLPVTVNAHTVYPTVSNEKINEYNIAIMELAKSKGAYFVDTAVSVMDDAGRLPTEASPSDGMHIGPEYYLKMFDYLSWHTAG